MPILEELWYGNVRPQDRRIKPGSDCEKLCAYIEREQQELEKMLPEKGRALLERLRDNQAELGEISQREAYIQGFRSGARLMAEVLGGYDFQLVPALDGE